MLLHTKENHFYELIFSQVYGMVIGGWILNLYYFIKEVNSGLLAHLVSLGVISALG